MKTMVHLQLRGMRMLLIACREAINCFHQMHSEIIIWNPSLTVETAKRATDGEHVPYALTEDAVDAVEEIDSMELQLPPLADDYVLPLCADEAASAIVDGRQRATQYAIERSVEECGFPLHRKPCDSFCSNRVAVIDRLHSAVSNDSWQQLESSFLLRLL